MRLRSPSNHWRADGVVSGYGGRRWWHVCADLAPGTTDVRWTYTTGPQTQGHGRGVYVDQVLAHDDTGVLFNGETRDANRFQADGWAPSAV
jgi:hypothetical protein